jgi:hypothetical protein
MSHSSRAVAVPSHRVALLLTILALPSAALPQPLRSCERLLFETGFDAQPIRGSKTGLAEAVERGEPIRVGWSLDFDNDAKADLTHWSDAQFLTVFEGAVFAQLPDISVQSPVIGQADVRLSSAAVTWRGMLGSNGTLQGTFSDGRSAAAAPHVAIRWCSSRPASEEWIPVYVNASDGTAEQGSKQSLIDAVRAGRPIQIGWGYSATSGDRPIQVEHIASPVFVSVIDGVHVVAQLQEHIAQKSYVDVKGAVFGSPEVMWRGLLSTTGVFDAVMVNRTTGAPRHMPQRARLVWFVQGGAPLSATPLSVPNGVVRDTARGHR